MEDNVVDWEEVGDAKGEGPAKSWVVYLGVVFDHFLPTMLAGWWALWTGDTVSLHHALAVCLPLLEYYGHLIYSWVAFVNMVTVYGSQRGSPGCDIVVIC